MSYPLPAPAPPAAGLGLLSAAQLAAMFHLDADSLRKALERWRLRNLDGWVEVCNPRKGQARYLFEARAVRHLLTPTDLPRQTTLD